MCVLISQACERDCDLRQVPGSSTGRATGAFCISEDGADLSIVDCLPTLLDDRRGAAPVGEVGGGFGLPVGIINRYVRKYVNGRAKLMRGNQGGMEVED